MEDYALIGFIVASLIVLLIPGPGVLYVIARSLTQGQKAGLLSVLGLSVGALVHVAAATLGLSAILLTSATAFNMVKILGAGYLIYIGLREIFKTRSNTKIDLGEIHSTHRLFIDGVIVSIFNPKIALFFIAFLPQFISPDAASLSQQILLLGLLYVALALITDSAYVFLSGYLRHWLGNRIIAGPLPQYARGLTFLGLGISTAVIDRR